MLHQEARQLPVRQPTRWHARPARQVAEVRLQRAVRQAALRNDRRRPPTRLSLEGQEREEVSAPLGMNDIGRVRLRTTTPIVYDSYRRNHRTGSFILIDEATSATVAAGMIV